MYCSRLRIAESLSLLTPFGTAANCASDTKWKPFIVVILAVFGTVLIARPLMSQPVVLAIIQAEPAARFFIVLPVPVSYLAEHLPISVRKAQVLSQPVVGFFGSESPRM